MANLINLVLDANGVCVIKRFMFGNKNQENRTFLMNIIISNGLEIIQNPFGNYIIQYIFELWGFEIGKPLLELLINNVISLSMQKYSSNVIEKCIDMLDKVKKFVLNIFLGRSKYFVYSFIQCK